MLSIIYALKNNTNLAREYEKIAEENANMETSGLQYHRHLGIVKERSVRFDKVVKRKCSSK